MKTIRRMTPIVLGYRPVAPIDSVPESEYVHSELPRRQKDRAGKRDGFAISTRVGSWRHGRSSGRHDERVDADRLLGALNLSEDERKYLEANYLDGIPRSQLAQRLGWNEPCVERVRVRLQRKIARVAGIYSREDFTLRGNSCNRLSYEEDLGNGRRCWSLMPLPDCYFEIMRAERTVPAKPERKMTIAA